MKSRVVSQLRRARAFAVTLQEPKVLWAFALSLMAIGFAGYGLVYQASTTRLWLVGEHDWRQSDTFSVAYNFVHDSANFFLPRIDMNRGRSGIMGMELPVFPYVAHLFMRVTGESAAIIRIFNWLVAMLGAGLCAWWLPPRGRRTPFVVAWALAVASSPMFLFEYRQIQPDPLVGSAAAIAAACLYRFSVTGSKKLYWLGVLAAIISATTKTPGVLLLPALWMFAWANGSRHPLRLVYLGLPFVVPVVADLLWFRWSRELNVKYNGGETYFAIEFTWDAVRGNLGNVGALKRTFQGLLPAYFVNWVALPLGLLGVVYSFRSEWRRVSLPMAAWAASFLFFSAAFSPKLWWHWYYAAPGFFAYAYFIALGFLAAYEGARSPRTQGTIARACAWMVIVSAPSLTFIAGPPTAVPKDTIGAAGEVLPPQGWGWLADNNTLWLVVALMVVLTLASRASALHQRLLPVLLLGAMLVVGMRGMSDATLALRWRSRLDEWPMLKRKIVALRAAADRYSTRKDLFISDFYAVSPAGLYRVNRKGFTDDVAQIDGNGLEYYRSLGAGFYVHYTEGGPTRPRAILPNMLLEKGDGWELHCIRRDGCPRLP